MNKKDAISMCTHTEWCVSHKKMKLAIVPTGMELEGIMVSKIREWQKLYDFTYVWDLKMKTNIIKHIPRYRGNRWLLEGRVGGRREIREGN